MNPYQVSWCSSVRCPLWKPAVNRRYCSDHERDFSSRFLCGGFCDASSKAYAAVVYLVTVSEDTEVTFVTIKSRVALLQTQTIPRLELLSALLLAHLITTVADSLNSTLPQLELKCFTDSQVRFKECRSGSPLFETEWWKSGRKFPPSNGVTVQVKQNPADLPSRGLSLLEISVSKLWVLWT